PNAVAALGTPFGRRCIPAPPHRAGKRAVGAPALTALLLPHIFPILHHTVHKTHGGGPLCGRRATPPGSPRRGLCAVGWTVGAPRRPRCDAGLSPRAAVAITSGGWSRPSRPSRRVIV